MSRALAGMLVATVLAVPAWSAEPAAPRLGRPATPAEIAAADLSIGPDGTGLPPGSGGVGQGAAVFQAKCQACHGPAGADGPMDRLTGGVGSIASPQRILTVASYWPYATTLFDYIRRAMPLNAPRSLSDDETYALVAYLLSVDKIVPADAVMDAAALPKVRMPNRGGFVSTEPRGFRPAR